MCTRLLDDGDVDQRLSGGYQLLASSNRHQLQKLVVGSSPNVLILNRVVLQPISCHRLLKGRIEDKSHSKYKKFHMQVEDDSTSSAENKNKN